MKAIDGSGLRSVYEGANPVTRTSLLNGQTPGGYNDILDMTQGSGTMGALSPTTGGVRSPNKNGALASAPEHGADSFPPQRLTTAVEEFPQGISQKKASREYNEAFDEAEARAWKRKIIADAPTLSEKKAILRELESLSEIACFKGETPVLMANGQLKRIDQVSPGDWIASRHENERRGRISEAQVAEVSNRQATAFTTIRLRTDGNRRSERTQSRSHSQASNDDEGEPRSPSSELLIEATAEHPFYCSEKGWVPAWSVSPGDRISSIEGEFECLSSETWISPDPIPVYNLFVPGLHTYFIGAHLGDSSAAIVWTHNSFPCKESRDWVGRSYRAGSVHQ